MRLLSLFAALTVLVLASAESGPKHGKLVMCPVFTQAMLNNMQMEFDIKDLDLNLCTHLFIVDSSFMVSENPWDSSDSEEYEEFKGFVALKEQYPHLKIIMGVHRTSSDFIRIAANPAQRYRFMRSAISFTKNLGVDGIDLAWSHSVRKITSEENETLVKFVEYMKEFTAAKDMSLSSSFTLTQNRDINTSLDVVNIAKSSDFVNFMQSYVNVISDTATKALENRHISNLRKNLVDLIQMGIPSEKIVMGLHFGGPLFNTKKDETMMVGVVGFNQICEFLENEPMKWEQTYHADASLVVIKGQNDNGDIDEIVYESTRSIANRVQVAVDLELAGVIASSVVMDDIHGKCGIDEDTFVDFKNEKPRDHESVNFPLLRTVNTAFDLLA